MLVLIFYVSKEYCYEFVNCEFEKWFNCFCKEIINYYLCDVLGEQEYNNLFIYIVWVMLGQVVNFEIEYSCDLDNVRILNKIYILYFDEQCNVIGFFVLEQDVIEQCCIVCVLKYVYDYMEQWVNQCIKKIFEINLQLCNEIEECQLVEVKLLEVK